MHNRELGMIPYHGFCACSYTILNGIDREPYFVSKMPVCNRSQKSQEHKTWFTYSKRLLTTEMKHGLKKLQDDRTAAEAPPARSNESQV